jgi:MFS family permease
MLLRNTFQFFKLKPAAALSLLFATSSLMLGVWAAALPFMKNRMGLSDGDLGLLLLIAPVGSLLGVYLSTRVFRRIKVGNWLGIGNIAQAVLFGFEVWCPYPWLFGILLFLRGLLGFLNGVALNTVISNLEREHKRKLLSTCHAIYSIGGAIGAGFAALMFGLGFSSQIQILLMLFALLVGILFLRPMYAKNDYFIHSGSGFKFPDKNIIGLSFICLVLFMCEGSVVDWSSIYLKRDILAPLSLISLGYGGFSIAMTLGRLNGDIIIPKFGGKKIIIFGTLVSALGFSLVSQSTSSIWVISGFVSIGIGSCCIVPVLFGAIAQIPNVSPVQGFGMITSGGLIGFVAGPSIIGFISQQWSLSLGFLFCVLMLLLASFVGWRNKFLT